MRRSLAALPLAALPLAAAVLVTGVALPAPASAAPAPAGWTATTGTVVGVTGGLRLQGRGAATAVLPSVRGTVGEVAAAVTVPARRTTTVSTSARRVAGRGEYRLEARTDAAGRASLVLVRQLGSRASALASAPLGARLAAGRTLRLRLRVEGTTPTRLSARAWPAGAPEPRGWALQVSDTTPALQTAGVPALTVRVLGRASASAVVRGLSVRASTPAAPSAPVPTGAPAAVLAPAAPAAPAASTPASSPTRGPAGPGTTGVPAGTALRVHHGDITVTRAGTVLDGLDVRGFVRVQAPGVVIRRSVVRGGAATGNIGLIYNGDRSATGLLVEDVTLAPAVPSVWIDGVKGGNVTVRRADISGTVDGVKVHGDDVVVEDSWIHDLRHYDADPNQGGRASHGDGVQVLSGARVTIRRNAVSGAHNAAVQVTQDHGAVTDLVIEDNVLDGGGCTVNLNAKPLGGMAAVVRANRFGRATRNADCAVIASRSTAVTGSGGTWSDTGAPVRVRDGG